ncbi:Uncharacterised protein [Yersinia thracica]|uniref:Uncharacterized protein n=1 Tax=Yersinia thracica TaxID=2890319 RepID=A0A0T9PWV2_9GAMM|nr:hypothetical protein [Yersinia thracica]CNH85716.1 Uncharacterised protein [Yersinia thracica]
MKQNNLDTAIGYIKSNIGFSLAVQIEALIHGHESGINQDLSTSANWGCISLHLSQQGPLQYHALMALLTCQFVFNSGLWPSMSGTASVLTPKNRLPSNWKDLSLRFWKNKAEAQIRDGLRMFISTTNNQDNLANAAQRWRPSFPDTDDYLAATRQDFAGKRLTPTCYDAVMLWLFKSGLVSLPWLLKYRNANTESALTAAFGRGTVIWNGAFSPTNRLPMIPRGHIVHIFEHQLSWNGHWMVSLGNGLAAGVNNNNEDPPVPRDYCTQLNLNKQLLDFGGGTAVVIDPFLIPGRL